MDLELIDIASFFVMVAALVVGVMIMDYLPDPEINPAVWKRRVMTACLIVAAVAGVVTVVIS